MKEIVRVPVVSGFIELHKLEDEHSHFGFFVVFKYVIYLFSKRGEGKEKRGRETSVCGRLSHGPQWGPDSQPRCVP